MQATRAEYHYFGNIFFYHIEISIFYDIALLYGVQLGGTVTLPLEERMGFRCFDSAKFKLSMPMICHKSKLNNESFLLKTRQNIKQHNYLRARYLENNECYKCHVPIIVSCSSLECAARRDDGYESPSKGSNQLSKRHLIHLFHQFVFRFRRVHV